MNEWAAGVSLPADNFAIRELEEGGIRATLFFHAYFFIIRSISNSIRWKRRNTRPPEAKKTFPFRANPLLITLPHNHKHYTSVLFRETPNDKRHEPMSTPQLSIT